MGGTSSEIRAKYSLGPEPKSDDIMERSWWIASKLQPWTEVVIGSKVH